MKTLTITRTLDLTAPCAEDAGARCDECWWGAAGPWSHLASAEHLKETGHQHFEYRGVEPAFRKPKKAKRKHRA